MRINECHRCWTILILWIDREHTPEVFRTLRIIVHYAIQRRIKYLSSSHTWNLGFVTDNVCLISGGFFGAATTKAVSLTALVTAYSH